MGDDRGAMIETARVSDEQLAELRAAARPATVSLVIYHRDGTRSVPLVEGQSVVVGRDHAADVAVGDRSLSRRHARFDLADGEVWVEDLGSTNGTRLNSERIDGRCRVVGGDEVGLGVVTASLYTPGPGLQTHGLHGHDTFRTLLDYEVARSRATGGKLALVMVASHSSVSRWSPGLRRLLRPHDQLALYSADTAEIMLPDLSQPEAVEMAQRIVTSLAKEEGVRCGVAAFPGAATSSGALISVCRAALQGCSVEVPVRVAPDDGARALDAEASSREPEGAPIVVSPAMQEVYGLVYRVARSVIPVLIQGETGVGKEVVARTIHERSGRAARPMICLNCGAIPEQLVESALFGHERGAFTGASQQAKGAFESADGGTVFLDEIGELSPAAQVALLRVLETKRLTRVGGSQEIAVDARVIAATHQDLAGMCEQGRFRTDLLYRLNTMVLHVPPLRERPEEIEDLARSFVERANQANQREVERIDAEALACLRRHDWPGNVRELRNAIERAVVIAQDRVISVDDLPQPIRQLALQGAHAPAAAGQGPSPAVEALEQPEDEALEFKERIQRIEARMIERALRDADFVQIEAARRLGIPMRTLTSKIAAYGLRKR